MAKKIRGKLNGLVHLAPIGGTPLPLSSLNGMTPKQHCSMNKGEFSSVSLDRDLCVTARGKIFSDDPPNSIISGFSYYYDVIESIELTTQTDEKLPNPNRTTIGVGEGITIVSNVPVVWEVNSKLVKITNQISNATHSIHLVALDKAGSVTVTAKNNYEKRNITLTILAPDRVSYSIARNGRNQQNIYHPKNKFILVIGLRIHIHPDTVNFKNVVLRELDSAANTTGIFNDGLVHCHLAFRGKPKPKGTKCNGIGKEAPVSFDEALLSNVTDHDHIDIVGGGEDNPNKLKNLPNESTLELAIPLQWKLTSSNYWHHFASTIKQSLTLYKNGNMTVCKGNLSFTVSKSASFEDDSFLK